MELLQLLVVGLIAGGIIGFFFGFKAGQMTAVKKLKLLAKADQSDP